MLTNIFISALGAPLAFTITICFSSGTLMCLVPMVFIGPISYTFALVHGLLFVHILNYFGLNNPIFLPLLTVLYIIFFIALMNPSMLDPRAEESPLLQYLFCGLCCCAIYHRRVVKSGKTNNN